MRVVIAMVSVALLFFATGVVGDEVRVGDDAGDVRAELISELEAKCSKCHMVSRVMVAEHDRAGWIRTVWFDMRGTDPTLFASYSEAEPLINKLDDVLGH